MDAKKRHRLRNKARRARNNKYERSLIYGGMLPEEARATRRVQFLVERETFGSYRISVA